jgi:hypothetical protein
MELRIHMYNWMRSLIPEQHMNPQMGFVLGAISGSIAAAATTPFDTIRCHMAVVSTQKQKTAMIKTIQHMFQQGGLPIFVRGIGFRASSNALRTSLFCLFYEMLLQHQQQHQQKQSDKNN